ncbi:MAG: phosphate ABC transporter substrate-binding protein PstS [Terriglobales bacterium]
MLGQITIFGAGSTFVSPIMSKWAEQFHKVHPDIRIGYYPNGNWPGMVLTMAGMIDFGATDAPVTRAQLAKATVPVVQVPVVLSADVPAYNLPSLQHPIRFTGQVLADIFLGKIKKWNDPAISTLNAGMALPDQEITVVHRFDDSGTTQIWTDYLSKVSSAWKSRVGSGTSVDWPVGLAATGNEGVSEEIREVRGAIGYLELSYAQNKKIPFGRVKNANGQFVTASLGGIKEAAPAAETQTQSRLRASVRNGSRTDAYPVASFTWILVPVRAKNSLTKKALREFLAWVVTDGYKYAADLYDAPPQEVCSGAAEGYLLR